MVEEFRWPLELAASCSFWRGTSLVTTARFAGGFFGSSPRLWWCSVLLCALLCVLFVWWWCSLWRVVYECFFFLYDAAACLLFQKKKSLNAKGLLSDKFDLYSPFALSEKKFLNRFMHPYKHMVPGLADAYASSCAGKGTQDIPI